MMASSISLSHSIVAVILVSVSYLAYRYALTRTSLNQRLKRNGYYGAPYYRHTDIVFGSDFQPRQAQAIAEGARQAWFCGLFADYGKTFETNHFGKRRFHTCDAVLAQEICTTNFQFMGTEPSRKPARGWLGEGVFSIDGEKWKRARNLLKPIFMKAEISDMTRLDKHLSRLMEAIAARNNEVELQSLFLRMYLDYSIESLFGEDPSTLAGDSSKIDATAFLASCDASLVQMLQIQSPWIIRWWKGWTKEYGKPFKISHAFVDQHVDRALQDAAEKRNSPSSTRSPAFIDELINQTGTTDRLWLRDQMLNIFFPARDTSGMAMSFIMFRLARHPEVYAKVRAEVLAAGLDKRPVTYDVVKSLTYVNAVISETLRLQVPAGHAARSALADTVLSHGGGINGDQPLLIPKNAVIFIHMHAMHHDPTYWGEDVEEFRPERWLDFGTVKQRRGWEYIPFLGGPRTCPAQAMVLAQLAYILVTFALRFREIENRDPELRFIEEHRMLMRIRNGVQIKLIV